MSALKKRMANAGRDRQLVSQANQSVDCVCPVLDHFVLAFAGCFCVFCVHLSIYLSLSRKFQAAAALKKAVQGASILQFTVAH